MTNAEMLEALTVAMGDIECGPQTRALLKKIAEELAERIEHAAIDDSIAPPPRR